MSAANTIEARDLVVDHETPGVTVRALELDALSVPGGTSLAIMGPSGCGKSTLLGLLAGLAVPTKGTVTIGGLAVSSLPERERVAFRRRALGMVYQADNLLPHLTVEENVGLQLAICRRDRDRAALRDRDRAALRSPVEVLARLGIAELAARLPDQLSGGQRQRAAVARAIVHNPDIMLADEPTGSLDPDSARGVIELLVELHREIGATLVIVTHDPTVAGHASRTVELSRPHAAEEPARAG